MNDNIIKMFIGGEEVVSNKEFTINEEMLSASSTILNNCYPASWEETKDYVSNFYYPKDYSKFILGKGNFTYGTDQYYVLNIESKNQFNLYGKIAGASIGYSINDNTLDVPSSQGNGGTVIFDNAYIGDTYTLSFSKVRGGTARFLIRVYNQNGVNQTGLTIPGMSAYNSVYAGYWKDLPSGTNDFTFTVPNEYYFKLGFIYLNYAISNIQLELGTTKTEYEIYNNDTFNFTTNVEKELQSFTLYGNSYQQTRSGKNMLYVSPEVVETNNLTITKGDDGVITINGTSSAFSYVNVNLNYGDSSKAKYFTLTQNKSYTLFVVGDMTGINCTVRTSNQNVPLVTTGAGNNIGTATYTNATDTGGFVYLGITGNRNYDNVKLKIMLVEGTYNIQNIGGWEQYGIMPSPNFPSELISVGFNNLLNLYISGTGVAYGVNYKINDDKSITLNGTTTGTFHLNLNSNPAYYIHFKKGKTYTSYLKNAGNNIRIITRYAASAQVVLSTSFGTERATQIYNNESDIDCFTYITIPSGTTLNNVTVYPMITEGAGAYSYLPYGKYGIELMNIGKNMFNKNTAIYDYRLGSDGLPYRDTNFILGDFISVLPLTTYNYSRKASSEWGACLCQYDENKNFISRFLFSNTSPLSINITLDFNTHYVRITDNKTLIDGMQFEIGSENTNYEDYKSNSQLYILNNPLMSANQIRDIAYVQNNTLYIERKLGIIELSSVSWKKYGHNVSGYSRYSTTSIPNIKYTSSNVIVGNGMAEKYILTNGSGMSAKTDMLAIDVSQVSVSAVDSPNGKFIYELATPYVEEIDNIILPNIYEGNNNFDLKTVLNGRIVLDYYWKNYDVLFAGIVKNSGDISLRPTNPKYCSLQILDYKTFLSESDTLDFVISDKTIAEAISMVVDAISGYGFVLGTIDISQADDIIGAYSTLNKTAYDVFQYLANISGSRWRARFVDSDTMAIDFYDPELLPRANDIDYTQQYWEDNKIVDLTFNYGTRDYRNKQIILSDEVYGGIDYTEVLLSNGYGTSYITQNNIANITSITVNGVEAEVITQSEKDLGVDADFYYTPGKNVVESTTSYTAGTQIIITYTPLVKGRQIVYNDEEVTRIATQTNTTGVISRYENRNDILSSDELENIAETYIKYKGKPEIILKLTTLNNDLFNIGEICYFNSPIADLAQDYMVKSKATNYTSVAGETNIFYTYELTSSFNSEKAINYFDNQRNKATGNIAEGESITRNIDINNSAMIIWENATITEISVSVDGDNALNSVLNSPFIQ